MLNLNAAVPVHNELNSFYAQRTRLISQSAAALATEHWTPRLQQWNYINGRSQTRCTCIRYTDHSLMTTQGQIADSWHVPFAAIKE